MITKEDLLKLNVNKIICYNRKSRSDSDEESVLSRHKEILEDFVKPFNIPYEIESEIGSSEELDYRVVFPSVLEKLENGYANAICYVEQSRLSRDVGDVKKLFKFFKLNNVIVIDLKNNRIVDFESESQGDVTFFESVIDELFIRSIKKVLIRGRKLSAKKGNALIKRMYGLQRNPTTKMMDIVEVEAEAIRLMYSMAIDGYSVKKIATRINELGYRSIKGNYFNYKQIWKILTSEAYKGWAIWGKQNWNKLDGKWVVKNNEVDKWYIVEDAWSAIIDTETWDKANKAVSSRGSASKKDRACSYWATALFRCSNCGRKLTVFKVGNNLYIRECQKMDLNTGERVCNNSGGGVTIIEDILINNIKSTKDEIIENIKNGIYKTNDSTSIQSLIQKKEQKIKEIQIKMDNLMDLLENGTYTIDMFNSRYSKHDIEIKELNAELTSLKDKHNEVDIKKEMALVVNQIGDVLDKIQNTTQQDERNRLYKSIIERIDWMRAGKNAKPEINIIYKYMCL